jgi:hypothetical protein
MLGRYLLTLLLTVTIEGAIAYLLGFRTRQYMLAIALINVITHVILNYLILVLGYLGMDTTFAFIATLEVLIVIAEWQMLVYVFHSSKGRFLLTSTLANAASFFIGVLLFWT